MFDTLKYQVSKKKLVKTKLNLQKILNQKLIEYYKIKKLLFSKK